MNDTLSTRRDDPILEVEDLHAGYGAIPVLHGMGKTYVTEDMIGALPGTAGSLYLAGRKVTRKPPYARAKLGMAYVPQGRDFPSTQRVRQYTHGTDQDRRPTGEVIETLLSDFPRLKTLLNRLGESLSGGAQQLLAQARAIGGNPAVLLDEPTEGIQPSILEEIAETLVRLRERMQLATRWYCSGCW